MNPSVIVLTIVSGLSTFGIWLDDRSSIQFGMFSIVSALLAIAVRGKE